MKFRKRDYAKIYINSETAIAFVDAVAPHDPDEALSTLLQMVIDEKLILDEDSDWCVPVPAELFEDDEDAYDPE